MRPSRKKISLDLTTSHSSRKSSTAEVKDTCGGEDFSAEFRVNYRILHFLLNIERINGELFNLTFFISAIVLKCCLKMINDVNS